MEVFWTLGPAVGARPKGLCGAALLRGRRVLTGGSPRGRTRETAQRLATRARHVGQRGRAAHAHEAVGEAICAEGEASGPGRCGMRPSGHGGSVRQAGWLATAQATRRAGYLTEVVGVFFQPSCRRQGK